MLNKTKAALQSCQCQYQKPKQKQNTRVSAGGQRMSQRNSAPADFIQDFGSSFAFWRWRRLISPFAAVTRNPAVLSPSCLKSSISSITSWGIRTVVICDFAFFAPVAITETPYVRCISVYAKKIKEKNINFKWFIIGYGGDEQLIHDKIKESGMEDEVIILGKKANPYPYIKKCDIYIQPSRYEGKAVTVLEAQMLGKPVVITDFPSSDSQLEDGIDGVIVPLDDSGCADGIVEVIQDRELRIKLVENCQKRDYSSKDEVEKLYKLMGD